MLDIVASYDGSDAYLYLDGKRVPRNLPSESRGKLHATISITSAQRKSGRLLVVYETLVFMPAGLLIGLAARRWSEEKISAAGCLHSVGCFRRCCWKFFSSGVSGRRMLAGNIALSLVFGLAGMLLINADRRAKTTTDPL